MGVCKKIGGFILLAKKYIWETSLLKTDLSFFLAIEFLKWKFFKKEKHILSRTILEEKKVKINHIKRGIYLNFITPKFSSPFFFFP